MAVSTSFGAAGSSIPLLGQIAAERQVSVRGPDQEIRIAPGDIVEGNQIAKLDDVDDQGGVPQMSIRIATWSKGQLQACPRRPISKE
ncbi:hypothetical protein [Allosphingosinicella deserti]|uniref:hypothetical protein n=1 Tax=Allosphingosinicella deserti TaxID=2116704 RepID=UPI0011B29948|nr:hypothetical protein [Sphingomonas deserti]